MNDDDKPDCCLGAVQLSTCRGDLNILYKSTLKKFRVIWTNQGNPSYPPQSYPPRNSRPY